MKRSACSVSPQLEDIPPDVWTEDKGAGPSSPADRLGVSRRPPLKNRDQLTVRQQTAASNQTDNMKD